MRTKSEAALLEAFESARARLPGGAAVAERRAAAMHAFARQGLPHRRIEEWKYTDLRNLLKEALPLAIDDQTSFGEGELATALGPFGKLELPRVLFVNGGYRKDLSSFAGSGAEVASFGETLATAGDKVAGPLLSFGETDSLLALNAACATDGAVIRVPAGARLANPLLIVNVQTGAEAVSVATRNVISVGADANAVLIELFVTMPGANPVGQANVVTEVAIAKGAKLSHVKLVAGQPGATHLATWILSLADAVDYRGFQMTSDVALARHDIRVTYKGQHSKLDLSGIMLGRGQDHIDTTLVVDHAVPHCESRELFKAVLDDRARAIFQGKVIVREGAQKSDGKQMAQALMLSPDAEFDSKPELEIYADDVVCGHGSTAAELDEDLLFYCRSRGITESEARALLIESFIGEAMDKVQHDGVREVLSLVASKWLSTAPHAGSTAA